MSRPCGKGKLSDMRIGNGMTVVLIFNVQGVAISTWLPVCGELMWIDMFLILNLIFVYLSLVESIIVVLLSSKNTAYLIPRPVAEFFERKLVSTQGLYPWTRDTLHSLLATSLCSD